MRRWTYLLLIFYLTCFGTFNPIHSRDSKETKSKNEGHRAAKGKNPEGARRQYQYMYCSVT